MTFELRLVGYVEVQDREFRLGCSWKEKNHTSKDVQDNEDNLEEKCKCSGESGHLERRKGGEANGGGRD